MQYSSFQNIADRYGAVKLSLDSFYKMCFTFTGQNDDGNMVTVTAGGSPYLIDTMDLSVDTPETILTLGSDVVVSVVVTSPTGETVDHYYYA